MSEQLAQRIAERIRRCGPMGMDEYMRTALLDAEHGYYTGGNPLGRDFVTAPEISQMFGELVGLWCAEMWRRMGKPAALHLVELGPGRGTLMRDALRAIGKVRPDCAAALEVHCVEASASLRRLQAATLASAAVPLHWHECVEEVVPGTETPPSRPGTRCGDALLVIANEFFDALPLRQFQYAARDSGRAAAGGGWCERRIALAGDSSDGLSDDLSNDDDNKRFAIRLVPAPEMEERLFAAVGQPVEGEIVELRPEAEKIARHIGAYLDAHCGALLLVDYGSAQRPCGASLGALRRDGGVSLLDALPGSADISAWVDFRALAAAAREGGDSVRVFGPVPQGGFLRRLGIVERAARLQASHADVARLVDPQAMGAVFKAMVLVSAALGDSPPPGFLSTEEWRGEQGLEALPPTANHG